MKTKRIIGSLALLLLICVAPLYAQNELGTRTSDDSKLRFAATQHEIISILIEENQFSAVPGEFEKILELNLSDERLIVQEAWIVTDGLLKAQRFDLAHQIVDMTLRESSEQENQFTLLMLKGKVYRQEGRLGDAISIFREAQSLREDR